MKIHSILNRFLAPAGDASDGGGASDRGDDFIPTGADATGATEVVVTAEDLAKVPKTKLAAEAEVEAEAETEVDKTTDKKDTRIPLARHKEILAKERSQREALERQIAQTRQADAVAQTNEQLTAAENNLLELEKQYAKLVVDGDAVKAAALMGEIRRAERGISDARSSFAIQAAEARAYERVQYDSTVERLEAAYPMLNEDHADFDASLMSEVVELRDGYVATGKYTRAQAIKKAAETLVGAATTRQKAAVTTEVKVDADAVAKAAAAERAALQRAKNGKVAATQPPSMAKIGQDHDKLGGVITGEAVMKMKYDDFVKLSENDLSRLRGDEL